MIDASSFAILEQAVYGLKENQVELGREVKILTGLMERIIRLEERAEGIKRAHQRIDTLVKMFWSGASTLALAIFINWVNKHS